MPRLFYAIGAGLIGAVLLHVIVILAVPSFTGLDAYSRVLDKGDINRFHQLHMETDDFGLSVSTPFLTEAVCAFSLAEGPVNLLAEGSVPFWSAAIYDTGSNELFSMSDRTAIGETMSIVVGTSAQLANIRKAANLDISRSILIEQQDLAGYVVLRAFYPEASMRDQSIAFTKSATCETMVLQQI